MEEEGETVKPLQVLRKGKATSLKAVRLKHSLKNRRLTESVLIDIPDKNFGPLMTLEDTSI
jgi:hypothetical protein